MAYKRIEAPDGTSFKVAEYEGRLFVPADGLRERIDNLGNLKIRHDDVFIYSYPKSGNHWVWEITMRLLTNSPDSFDLNFGDYIVDVRDDDYLARQPSPRALLTHHPLAILAKAPDFIDGHHRAVYIIRNPKDVSVSFYNQIYRMHNLYGYDGAWWGFFELFIQGKVESGSWFDHVLQWEQFQKDYPKFPIHFIYFEDLKQDMFAEIKKLAEFLCVHKNDDFYRTIESQCGFSSMKKSQDAIAQPELLALYRDGKSHIFRKGVVSDWKNYFTVEQSERFDNLYARKMKDSQLKVRFTL